jgi:Kef-type K+ transport system membrane component KefB
MQQTRVGVVLVGAAMMDDVVGLVMVNIVTTLGSGGIGGWPIARPIIASFGLLLVTLAIAPLLSPVWRWTTAYVKSGTGPGSEETIGPLQQLVKRLIGNIPHISFILSTTVLILFVTIASFIDASILFSAFIAGGVVSFLWAQDQERNEAPQHDGPSTMYERYFKSAMDFILVPFFFVSTSPTQFSSLPSVSPPPFPPHSPQFFFNFTPLFSRLLAAFRYSSQACKSEPDHIEATPRKSKRFFLDIYV